MDKNTLGIEPVELIEKKGLTRKDTHDMSESLLGQKRSLVEYAFNFQ